MTKTELVNELSSAITSLDLCAKELSQQINLFIKSNKLDNKQASHLQWELASMNQHYVEYVHDLERIIKTLNGEPFAG
jgi:hypothetical protein